MTGNCVGQRNRPSRQLEVPEKGFGEVIKLISSPTHSPWWHWSSSALPLTVCRATSVCNYSWYDSIPHPLS